MVPPPENVRINSVNFKNILQWDSPAFPKGNLTFTAEYQSYMKFQGMCQKTALTECNFSSLSKYGDHTLRVRAEFENEQSDWVYRDFCPVEDTIIGPPGIQVEVITDSLHLRFLAPKIENEPETWTMKNIYNLWAYEVQYWKNGTDKKEKVPVTPQYDFWVLKSLEPWTTYCVQVRGSVSDRNRTGEWSEPVCKQTSKDDTRPSWMVAVILIASVLVVFLALLACFAALWCIYKKTKHIFSPRNALPQHLKEFLGHPHHSTRLIFSFPLADESEVFDKLSVITEDLEGSRQHPNDSCGVRTLLVQEPLELVPQEVEDPHSPPLPDCRQDSQRDTDGAGAAAPTPKLERPVDGPVPTATELGFNS